MKIAKPLLLFALAVGLVQCTKNEELKEDITVTNVYPQKAKVNAQVDITGSGFTQLLQDSAGVVKVYFGNTVAHATVVNDTLVSLIVPVGATSGPVCVEWKGKKYCSTQSFTVLPGNTVQNTFMRLPDYPGNWMPGSMFAVDENIYVGGINDFWKFNTETFQWSRIASMPEWGVRTSTFVIDTKAYVFGGLTYTTGNGSKRLYRYDPANNTWTEKASRPTATYDAAVFVYNGKAYIAGGERTPNELWEYDPQRDAWTQKADLPLGTAWGREAYRLNDRFYVPGQLYSGTQEYDPQTHAWRTLAGGPDFIYAAVHSSRRWQNMAYIVGGRNRSEVLRVSLGGDNNMLFSQSIQYPINPGGKDFELYTSLGEELFFLHVDHNTRRTEFWEYLPE